MKDSGKADYTSDYFNEECIYFNKLITIIMISV